VASSVLELRVGGVPFPHGDPTGTWRYRHAVRPGGATPLDHQAVADFHAYETAFGRKVVVEADPELEDWPSWPPPDDRPRPDQAPTQCCTHVFEDGCGAELVCHGTTAAAAAIILTTGRLLASTHLTGRTGEDVASTSTWGEPADYFEHVMFAHGRCTAPEAVSLSRLRKRDLVPTDLRAGYPTAVRFYFDWDALRQHTSARFDGVHPIKIRGELAVTDGLVAVVINTEHADLIRRAPPSMPIIAIDIHDPTPDQWATTALDAARQAR